jgi:uncharacterized membrane protein YfcA
MSVVAGAYALVCVFGAAIVRGFAGFGFSLLAITAISLVFPPAVVVPSIFLMEIAASIHLLPSVWQEVHWRAIGLLLAGCLLATPLGVWLLATAPAAPMHVALGIVVLIAAVLLARGYALHSMPGPTATVTAGAASGLLNGAFGIGGPPVILFFFASPAGVAAGRASVIAYFLGTDLIGLAFMLRQGLVGPQQLWLALAFLPALLAGNWLGARGFRGIDPEAFRRWVLWLLILLAILTGAKGLSALGGNTAA